jgi:hypothetical protein
VAARPDAQSATAYAPDLLRELDPEPERAVCFPAGSCGITTCMVMGMGSKVLKSNPSSE